MPRVMQKINEKDESTKHKSDYTILLIRTILRIRIQTTEKGYHTAKMVGNPGTGEAERNADIRDYLGGFLPSSKRALTLSKSWPWTFKPSPIGPTPQYGSLRSS